MNYQGKLVILVLANLVLLGVLGFGLYGIRAEKEESLQMLGALGQSAEEQVLSQSIRVLRETASNDIQIFEDFILGEDRIVEVIEGVENVGRSLGLTTRILSVNKGEAKAEDLFQKITIVVEGVGSWNGNFSYLKAIESLPHKVVMDKVELSKVEGGWRLEIALTLSSFD